MCVRLRACVRVSERAREGEGKPCNCSTVCRKFHLCILAPPLLQPTQYAQQSSPPWKSLASQAFLDKPPSPATFQRPLTGLPPFCSLHGSPPQDSWLYFSSASQTWPGCSIGLHSWTLSCFLAHSCASFVCLCKCHLLPEAVSLILTGLTLGYVFIVLLCPSLVSRL